MWIKLHIRLDKDLHQEGSQQSVNVSRVGNRPILYLEFDLLYPNVYFMNGCRSLIPVKDAYLETILRSSRQEQKAIMYEKKRPLA